jgi:hypothetical protein
MTDATSQNDALEALKAFNSAVTTKRLYPADAPQIPAAVEKAYLAVKHYLRMNGDLVFSIENDVCMLCGMPIQKQTLGKFNGADVFQHMKLLELRYTVIPPGIDRKTFKEILAFFVTSPQKIRKEGGGALYAVQLGLSEVFPVTYSVVPPREDPGQGLVSFVSSFSDIQDEWISSLFGKHEERETDREIPDIFKDPDRAARTLAAGIAKALQEIRKKEMVDHSPTFEQILENANGLINPAQQVDVALKAAALLLQGLKGPLLGDLFSQSFPGVFGEALFSSLLKGVSNDELRGGIEHLLARERTFIERFGNDSSKLHIVRNAISRLLKTPRGRQFQALEKTRAAMESGEQERRKKRLQVGLNAILQGNTAVLQNEEIVQHLPLTVERLLARRKDAAAALLIENVAKELLRGNKQVQSPLCRSLCRIGEILLQARKLDWLDMLSGPFLFWVKEVDGEDAVYERIITLLNHIMLHGWQVGNTGKADRILNVFFKIRTGMIRKSASVRTMTGRVQDQFVDRTTFPILLAQCLAESTDEMQGQRLSRQGPAAARFLITALLSTDDAGERIKILDLLADMGTLLTPILIEKLADPMPWFGKRNLLKLLTETGNEEHVDAALACLSHDDLRVQREAFACVYKISGNNRKKVLLQALPLAGEIMKVQVVKALAPLVDDHVVMVLVDLLQNQKNFFPDVKGPLIQQICLTLSGSSSQKAIETLEAFLVVKGKDRDRRLNAEVFKSAERALQQIEINQQKQGEPSPRTQLPDDPQAQSVPLLATDMQHSAITNYKEERQVRDLLEQQNTAKAKTLLADLIEKTARLKQFGQAEQLRDWLIRIDPQALMEIIRTAEIIENEKTLSIDKDHLQVWSSLYDILTTEEFNALYYSFEHKHYTAENIIVKQGTIHPFLYFINRGRVKLYYCDNAAEILVRTMGQGEVFGAGAFFEASVWTINVASLGQAEVSILSLEKIKSWKKEHPALESKLHDFCIIFEGLKDDLLKAGKDRRGNDRVAISGRVTTNILDPHGKDMGIASRCDLTDISLGGLSFFIHIQKKSARLLLGRAVRVVLPAELVASAKDFNAEGTIVAVHPYRVMHNEYSAHVRFDQPLRKQDFQGIIDADKKAR